ncbi:MAG: hypothetical protein Q4D51_04340 [Eubacteriales bacterium]|nr:hypothetical protein [Eubacteriales bacterium]
MGTLFETNQGTSLLFYASENHIILRKKKGETFSRPITLASDYFSDLTQTLYNGNVYYSYINDKQEIIVKNITENQSLFTSEDETISTYYYPVLTTFQKQLFLFYIMKNPFDNSYSIKCNAIFTNNIHFIIPDTYKTLPKISLTPLSEVLLISIYDDFSHKFILMDSSFSATPIGSSRDFSISQCQQHKQELEAMLQQCQKEISANTQENNQQIERLNQEILSLQSKLSIRDQLLQERKKEYDHMSSMLESAKTQYNELMQIANQYRQEAIKWHNKLHAE